MKRALLGTAVMMAFIAIPISLKVSNARTLWAVEQRAVEFKQIQRTVLASGNFAFRQEVQLSSEVIGKVAQVLVNEGDKVLQGQVLLRLDPGGYRAEVARQEAHRRSAQIGVERAELKLANRRRSVERSQRLARARLIDLARYEEAKHEFELAVIDRSASRAALSQADAWLALVKERLAKTEVRSPISGTITAVQIKTGETAIAGATGVPGSSLMTIAEVGDMMAEVNVDEADIGAVTRGLRARVSSSAFPDKPLDATVERVSLTPRAGPHGRAYVVKLGLHNNELAVRTGMTCRVEILLAGGTARPVIPLQAVLTGPPASAGAMGSNYAFAVVGGVVHRRQIVLGMADDAGQEVLSGLATGDIVAAGPAHTLRELREGDSVTSLDSAPAPATDNVAGITERL
jgi:HlyD family secretion protein